LLLLLLLLLLLYALIYNFQHEKNNKEQFSLLPYDEGSSPSDIIGCTLHERYTTQNSKDAKIDIYSSGGGDVKYSGFNYQCDVILLDKKSEEEGVSKVRQDSTDLYTDVALEKLATFKAQQGMPFFLHLSYQVWFGVFYILIILYMF
jgi:poly-gamma-glutamate capsule biosynthesis protein CapA/YwtB (metallophosphatase superfamily)